jgi:hypothetical protein
MICSCGAMMTPQTYTRTDDGVKRYRQANRCPQCGRIEWLMFWESLAHETPGTVMHLDMPYTNG